MKQFSIYAFLISSGLLLSSLLAHAADEGVHTGIHHHYQSMRAMGMGDAFVAVTDDYSAIFYNPAALARRTTGQMNGSIEVGVSNDLLRFYSDFDEAAKAPQSEQFDKYTEVLQKYYGKHMTIRSGLFEGFWVRPGWGVAFIPSDLTVEYRIHNQGAPAINLRTYLDTTLAYSHAQDVPNKTGKLSWGATAKFINRGYINTQINALDLQADNQIVRRTDFRDGYTLDFDLGALYTPDLPGDGFWYVFKLAKPTFGLVVRNLLDYGFGQSFHLINKEEVAAPEKLNRVVDVGAKFEYPEVWIFKGRGAIDFRDILHPNINFNKSLHIGFEFDWEVANWWKGAYRVGLNQMFLTAGVSAKLAWFNLDLATYGEDVGTYKTPKENRVYMAKFNFDM